MRIRVDGTLTATRSALGNAEEVDVGIATLLAKLGSRGKFDRVILLAGDGDFEDAIDFVKSELDKEVWIAGYPNSVSTDLQSYSDQMIWISDFWKQIEKP